mgnify:CR=1 FL=1
MKKLEEYVISIPDFPEPGIIFRDITSILQDPDGLKLSIDSMIKLLDGVDFDIIAGAESRGFIFGMPIAYALGKAFIPVRKKGKLPCETVSAEYDLEYGKAEIEIHKDAVKPGQKVVLVDDLIATGGTMEASCKLVEQLGGEVVKILFLMELAGLKGREKLAKYDVASVILASNLLFEELDNDTLKNLVTIPVNRTKLVLSKMLVLLLFAIGFMAVGALVILAALLIQGWNPVGFWKLFQVGIGEGVIMWVGALPCILIVVLLDKNYIVSVVITFFYTILNYLLTNNDAFLTQPFGLNAGTLLPGPLAFRWTFQFYDYGSISEELAELLERISPYFLNDIQVFGVAFAEAAVFLALIAMVYRRREI